LLAFPDGRAAAQCTLVAPPLSFEPNPPGVSRNGTNLSSGKQSDLQVYQSGGSPRMLMLEAFGYSVLDLSNPANPFALAYDNMSFSGEVPTAGDGQSDVASIGVSPDGQRFVLSLNGNASPMYGTVVGSAGGAGFNHVTGGFTPRGAGGGVVIQHVGSRYIAYALLPSSNINPQTLSIVDVTSPPASLGPTNMTPETMAPGGFNLTLAGNNVLYLNGATIRILDASNPGPAGNIQSGFQLTTISSIDLGGGTPNSFSAAVDPSDPAKLWILAEVTFTGQPAPGWVLLSLKNGVKTPTGAPFQIQPGTGETWGTGNPSALIPAGGSLVALMWGKKASPSVIYRLFSSSVAGWGTINSFDVDPAVYPTFALRSAMRGFAGAGNSVYAYVPTGNSAYALSLSCVTVPAPPVSSLAVQYATCPGSGACPLNPGDTVFVGTQLLATPTAFGLHALTDWRFDFDWHPPAEDNVSLPRLKFPDLSSPASGATPPASIALYGPCDPRAGGTPSSGAGCWSSVTSNGDFSANAPAGATSSLTLAFEAANDLGAGNTTTFPIVWKIPAVRLQSPNILLGQSVQSASDGTPLSTGYKWYFGATPTSLTLSSCTGASCAPLPPFNAKGTYYYWLTVPYPTGYTSPDCGSPCTRNLGSFSVTDVALAFSGIASTVVAGGTVTATDGSSVAPGVASCPAGLQYSLCDASAGSCAAGSWQSLALSSSLGSGGAASIPLVSVAGAYWLRIRYSYTTTGSCTSSLVTSWVPSVSGVSDNTAWPIAVTPAPPSIDARVNGLNPCVGAGGGCVGGLPANVGDTITVNAIINGRIDTSPPLATLWTFGPSASPASCAGAGCQGTTFHFTGPGTFTITLAGYAIGASTTFTVAAPPVVASNGGPVCAGSPLALFASPNISGATFSWTGPSGFTSTLQNPVVPAATTPGTYTVVRTFGGQTSTASTSGVVIAPPLVPTAGNNGPLCAGQTLTLTAATVAGAAYAWTGPNGFTSALQNPSLSGATAAATGTYIVTATVNGCSSAASTGVTVNVPPPAPAAGNNGPFCAGGTLALTAATIANATYAWTGPNGFTSALQNPSIPNATAAAGGVYSVTAAANGCTGPAGSTAAVVNSVSAAITAPSRICLAAGNTGTASVPDAGGGAAYVWTIANGAITGGQGTASISFSVAGAGTATLGVTVTAGGCAPTGSATIPVQTQCGGLSTLTPCRAVDTRNVSGPFGGPPFPANGLRSFNLLLSGCGIPSTAKAVSANLTVVSPTASGALHVYPGDLGTAPSATAISFSSGRTRANNAILRLATDGSGTVAVQSESGGPFDLVIDVNGYFE
jgi:Ig-like domain CHU_C associated